MQRIVGAFDKVISDVSQVADRACQANMHPASAGNYSLVINREQLPVRSLIANSVYEPWKKFSEDQSFDKLKGAFILAKTKDKLIADISASPESALGIIEIDPDGKQYRKIWGFNDGKSEPSTELLESHLQLLNDNVEMKAVIHSHPVNTNAVMLSGQVHDDKSLNKLLWQGSTAGMSDTPNGVKWLDWCAPGKELRDKTAAAFKEGWDAVLWDRHGIIAMGNSIKDAFGKIQSIEHTMETVLKASAATSAKTIKWLSIENLQELLKSLQESIASKARRVLALFSG